MKIQRALKKHLRNTAKHEKHKKHYKNTKHKTTQKNTGKHK